MLAPVEWLFLVDDGARVLNVELGENGVSVDTPACHDSDRVSGHVQPTLQFRRSQERPNFLELGHKDIVETEGFGNDARHVQVICRQSFN
jgi:hypothetical protein